MAKDKKGFILYADQKELFDQLPNEKAGELIKFIFAYVNDEEPVTTDLLLKLAFTPIKQQFKRDLEKWENTREGRSKAGKASAEARKRNKEQQELTNSTNVDSVQQTSTNPTVSVNDNVTVNAKVKENNIKGTAKTPTQKVLEFVESDYDVNLVAGFKRFVEHLDKTKHVKNIASQITIGNYEKLCIEHEHTKIWGKITELDNWLDDPNVAKNKKKKKSVYHLMALTWLKNGY